MSFKWIVTIFTVLAAAGLVVKASHVILRPLKAHEVYAVLEAAGRQDAIPEGRVISQGIAALTGFSAGVVSGVGGAIVYDLITAPNETIAWINGLFGINTTTATSSSKPPLLYTQEICFASRSLDDEPEERQAPTTLATTLTSTSPTMTNSPSIASPTTTVSSPSPTSTTGTMPTTPTTGVVGGPTCIVVEKPRARHRRRRSIIRKIKRQNLKLKLD